MVVLEQLDEAQARRMKERSEWARKAEERRLDKLKAYNATEEIQALGQKQAALVEKMIQDLFALTPEWEIRRMKARAVSTHLFRFVANHSPSFTFPVVQSQSRQCESTLDPVCRRQESQDRTNPVRVTQPILIPLYHFLPPFTVIVPMSLCCTPAHPGRIHACGLDCAHTLLVSLGPPLQPSLPGLPLRSFC